MAALLGPTENSSWPRSRVPFASRFRLFAGIAGHAVILAPATLHCAEDWPHNTDRISAGQPVSACALWCLLLLISCCSGALDEPAPQEASRIPRPAFIPNRLRPSTTGPSSHPPDDQPTAELAVTSSPGRHPLPSPARHNPVTGSSGRRRAAEASAKRICRSCLLGRLRRMPLVHVMAHLFDDDECAAR